MMRAICKDENCRMTYAMENTRGATIKGQKCVCGAGLQKAKWDYKAGRYVPYVSPNRGKKVTCCVCLKKYFPQVCENHGETRKIFAGPALLNIRSWQVGIYEMRITIEPDDLICWRHFFNRDREPMPVFAQTDFDYLTADFLSGYIRR